MEAVLGGLLIFVLRVIDVSMGTMRILMTVRGRKLLAALIGFVEVTIFVVAISAVVRNATNVWSVLGYAAGFAVGTLVGMSIEERLALGFMVVRIISSDTNNKIAEALREIGCGVTEIPGHGLRGDVEILEVVVPRHDLPTVLQTIDRVDSKAFVTVDETQRVYRGYRLGKGR